MSFLQKIARKTSGTLGRESWIIRRARPVYESLLERTSQGKGILWPINGVTYRIDPRHRHQLGQNYDARAAAFIRERIKPGAVCVDVGANVGIYVLQFAHWSGDSGCVVAFEPNPGAREVLQKHIVLNHLAGRVRIVPAAVGATVGEAILYAAGSDGMSRLGAPNQAIADNVAPVPVPVVTLDSFCEAEDLKPDWLFIDIEGFEIAALVGARKLIEKRGAALTIIVEMHPNVWDSADTTRAQAESLLNELRLHPVPLTGQTDPLGDYGLVHLTHK